MKAEWMVSMYKISALIKDQPMESNDEHMIIGDYDLIH